MINISLCENAEASNVQKFINEHWKKGHILVRNNILFEWLYKNKSGYNFLIAKKNKSIIGVLGFIKNSHFDEFGINKDIIWLALWKVNDKVSPPGLGLILLKKLENMHPNIDIAVLGINKDHPKIYKAINYFTGIMKHYYLTNPDIKKFNILINSHGIKLPIPKKSDIKLIARQISADDLQSIGSDLIIKENSFYKSTEFFINKYLTNPFYNYKVFEIKKDNILQALLVLRIINIKNCNVIRVIDFDGDESIISNIGLFFLNLMRTEKAEYVDFVQYGIDKKYFLNSGFKLLDLNINVIVPNYFEPLIQKNIPLLFSYKTNNNNIRIFKGDGDQDRPNLVVS